MSTEAELDAITQTRGTCPICAEDGKTVKKQLHGLASHLMKEHTVDQLVYQIAGEAVIDALDEQETPKFAEGGFVEGPKEPIAIDLGCEYLITADELKKSPSLKAALEKFGQSVKEVKERESRDGNAPNT